MAFVTHGFRQVEVEAKRLMDEAMDELVAAVKEIDPKAEVNLTSQDEWLVTCDPSKAKDIGLALVALNEKKRQ